MIDEQKQRALIVDFERTFAPFSEDGRANFLWVRHTDKVKNNKQGHPTSCLELHFIMPRTDLKTGRQFNIHPPGKQNLDFYKAWVECKNFVFQFEQVNKKPMSFQQFEKSKATVERLKGSRAKWLSEKFDKPMKRTFNKKKGGNYVNRRTRATYKNNNLNSQPQRDKSVSIKFSHGIDRANQFKYSANTDVRAKTDYANAGRIESTQELVSSVQVVRNTDSGNTRQVSSTQQDRSNARQAQPVISGDIDNQITALFALLDKTPLDKRASITARINALIAQKLRQQEQAEQQRLRLINLPK